MDDDALLEFGKKSLEIFSTEDDDTLFDLFRLEHAKRNNSAIIVGDIMYFKNNKGVEIPANAILTKTSDYQSAGNDWKTYDFETANKYYSITLSAKDYKIVSRFVTDK